MLSVITNEFILNQAMQLTKAAQKIAPSIKILKFAGGKPETGVVMCHLRDGHHYLPHFLNHYRSCGVKKFAFIDNGSEDRSVALLLDQSDCDVYQCLGDFKSSLCGTIWHNIVMSNYQSATWILNVDIDEFAIYDGWPHIGLEEFSYQCSAVGLGAVSAIMIDMYESGALAKARRISESQDLFGDFSYFDGDGYTRLRIHNWRQNFFPRQIIDGGPSKRIFQDQGHEWLAKTPFILEPGIIYLDPHTVLPIGLNFNPPLIALMHFRLNGDLTDKIRMVDSTGYTKGSITSYQKFGSEMERDPLFSLSYSGSEKFATISQLLNKDMIRSPIDTALFRPD